MPLRPTKFESDLNIGDVCGYGHDVVRFLTIRIDPLSSVPDGWTEVWVADVSGTVMAFGKTAQDAVDNLRKSYAESAAKLSDLRIPELR